MGRKSLQLFYFKVYGNIYKCFMLNEPFDIPSFLICFVRVKMVFVIWQQYSRFNIKRYLNSWKLLFNLYKKYNNRPFEIKHFLLLLHCSLFFSLYIRNKDHVSQVCHMIIHLQTFMFNIIHESLIWTIFGLALSILFLFTTLPSCNVHWLFYRNLPK